jgi:vacuolar-type H+-ATPase subunit I/STV1
MSQLLPILSQAEGELSAHTATLAMLRNALLRASEDSAVLSIALRFHDESGGDAALALAAAAGGSAAGGGDGLRRRRGAPRADGREIEMSPVTPAGAGGDDDDALEAGSRPSRLNTVVCGIIDTAQIGILDRVVGRLSRGNVYARYIDVADPFFVPDAGRFVKKTYFYMVLLGRGLETKVQRLCGSLGGRIVALPPSSSAFAGAIMAADTAMTDARAAIQATERMLVQILSELAGVGSAAAAADARVLAAAGASFSSLDALGSASGLDLAPPTLTPLTSTAAAFGAGASPLRLLEAAVTRERHVIETLSRAAFTERYVILEGWIPRYAKRELVQCMARVERHDTSLSPPAVVFLPAAVAKAARRGPPPTHLRTDSFTSVFQAIVDTYGVPRYREVNPGVFTIVTFPFLFAVMFGDIGHGAALLAAGLFFVLTRNTWERRARQHRLGELAGMLFHARWMLLFMGIFAVYMGFIYNDLFSLPVNPFGSHFKLPDNDVPVPQRRYTKLWDGGVYPFGLDPEWAHAKNELAFRNSFKMKMAVIIGVLHMLLGVALSLFNHVHFGDFISLFGEFIPRFVFMACTFGYMCFMILYKWCVDWHIGDSKHGRQPPNLIQSMILMFLRLGDPGTEVLYAGQKQAQRALLFLALACIPVMFFAKPLAQYHKQSQRSEALRRRGGDQAVAGVDADAEADDASAAGPGSGAAPVPGHGAEPNDGPNNGHGDAHEAHSLSDLLIHQAIHTIEFILGAVSNTASYLRLWALSLAHAQLSAVFWDKILWEYGVAKGPFFAFIGFAGWAGATGGVLLGMDALECFLHALRLHWVEFQNKFYYADGKPWAPISLQVSAVSLGEMAREAQAERRRQAGAAAAADDAAEPGTPAAGDSGYYELESGGDAVTGAGGGGGGGGGSDEEEDDDDFALDSEDRMFAHPSVTYDSEGRPVNGGGLLTGPAESDSDEDEGFFQDEDGGAVAEARNRLMSRMQYDST